jgi:hypothetical protein
LYVYLKSRIENGTFELRYGTAELRTIAYTIEKRQNARASAREIS